MYGVNKIFCIQGMSGAGKDTLVNKVSELLDIPILISHTTRPIRDGEVKDKTYYFVNDDFFKNQHDNFLELRNYQVWNGDIWHYGLHKIEVLNKPYSLFIVDRQGYEELKETFDKELISIMINVDKEELIKRLKARGDNHKEISRRIEDDIKRFDGFVPDYIIENNILEESIVELSNIIKSEMGKL